MKLPNADLCTGCGVCEATCSKGAIKLEHDSCGFLHPVFNSSLCSGCKMCEKACPLCSDLEKSKVKKVFAARAVDKSTEEKSSSGGAFSVFAEYVLDAKGVIYGAGFDDEFNVCHKRITHKEDLKLVRGSKYVQSSFLNAATEAKKDLKEGRTVLFSGTPCQIAALKNMTSGINKGELYTVDFICHGVASPKLFEKYRDFISDGREISSISFRDKTEGWQRYSMKISFADGTSYRRYAPKDPYMLAYAQNVTIRSSCNSCAYVGSERLSDITLGDAWNQSFENTELKDGRGVSLVLVNTKQGNLLLSEVKDKIVSEELSLDVLPKIKPLNIPTKVNPLKNKYYNDMHKLSFDRLTAKYCGMSADAKLRRFIARKIYNWRNSFE